MGKIKVTQCGDIEGLKVIEPTVFGDSRGYFMETYNYNDFKEAGIDVEFVQDNQSSSRYGVLRGLHFQINYPQDKLVRVVSGEVFDVAVDLREGSETYGQWYGVVLSAENKKQFFIPKGFAHGFLVLSDIAEFCGFSQGMSYSFESPKVFDKLLLPEDSKLRNAISIMNPLGEDYSIMRTTSLNGMLTSLATNYNRRNKNVRLYEMGNIYIPKELPLTELPDERMQFTLGMYGDGDFFNMKGVVEEFFEKIGMKGREKYDPNAGKSFLHPGRQANIIYDGKVVGYLGEVHPEVADIYGIGERAYVAVLDMPEIIPYATFDRKYTGIAKYPAVTRDISMVVPKEILVGQIEDVIEKKGGAHLESFNLFDIYEGAQIKAGFKSVAYSIVFRAKDKTLEEAEITAAMDRILSGLEELGIELRK